MNKKLLAVAIAAAFAAPMAASADATIYGAIHTSIEKNQTKTRDGSKIVDNWDVIGNDGQLGIKGSEDLGGGNKALYKVELNMNTAGGDLGSQCADGNNSARCQAQNGATATMTWDEVWVGLSGGWGTALIGREDTPYKTFLDSPGVDILGDSIVDIDTHLVAVGGGGFERFTANGAIAYVSPNFSGFTLGGAIVPGGQTPGLSSSTNVDGNAIKDGIADHYSIAGNYVGGGLKIALGYEKKVPLEGIGTTAVEDQKNTGIAGSYTFNNFFIGAKYEQEKGANFARDTKVKRGAVTGKFTFGKNAVGLVYGQSETKASGVETNDSRGYGAFFEHNLSNRTKAYIAYNDSKDKKASAASDVEKEKAFALGVVHSF